MAKIKKETKPVLMKRKSKINGFKNKKNKVNKSKIVEQSVEPMKNGFKNKARQKSGESMKNGFKKNKGKGKKSKPGEKSVEKYKEMSVDDFLNNVTENSEEELSENEIMEQELSENEVIEQESDQEESVIENKNKNEDSDDSDIDLDAELNKDGSDDEQMEENDSEDEAEAHKKSLQKLSEIDPEFFSFLQENDKKLLQFNLSDEEPDEDGEKEDDEDETVHKPTKDLEVASDESDYEGEDDEPKDERIITLKLLKQWQNAIQNDKTSKTINFLMQAFHAALRRVSSEEEGDDEPCHFKVDGSAVFNGVIQLCVLELGPGIKRFLGLQQGSKQPPHKCKKFIKVKKSLKLYFTDLLKLLMGVTSSNIQTVLLKHLHYMSPMIVSYPNITKSLIKRLITLWGQADDSVRVIAFFCILRITNNQQQAILDTVLKSMYLTYVKNSKFVSTGTLASINFMRRSLVEMFALDVNVAYSHVFLYIRQLAIHLRNAITINKKENTHAVYNWQYVNSLRLWGNLISVTYNKPVMQQLVYPLVQICLGTIKLVPTAQYYPLRFHITQILMDLSRDTGVFIPILPFLLDVLTSHDFNKKHQKVSMKPMNFTCVLRLSKSQLIENGFKDMTIDTIYGQVLEYLSNQSHTISFPDLSLICLIQIKVFLKKCKNTTYTRKLKQVIEKIEQNSSFIEKERARQTFNLNEFKKIEGWETTVKNKGTPFTAYYESWNKLRNVKKNKQLTNNEELGEYNLPVLKKHKKSDKKSEGPVVLFPSDSEDEEDEDEMEKPKRRGKRGGKNSRKYAEDNSGPVEDDGSKDLVQDIDVEDW